MKLHHLHEDFILPDEGFKRPSPLFITMFMVVVLALTVLLSELIGMAGIGSQSQLMIYILAVLIISCTTPEYLYGIVSALFCSFTFDFLVTAPRMSFSFTIGYPITLITMLLVTFVTSTLTVQIKRQVLAAQDRERRGQLLQEINRKLLGVRDVDSIVHITNEYLVNHLHRPTVFYTRDPGKATEQCFVDTPCQACSTAFFHTEAETKRVHRIFLSGGVDPAAVFDDVEPDVYYVPMASKGKLLGLIGVGCQGNPLNHGSRSFLQAVSGQVALALELQYISDEQSRTVVNAEKEKIRSTLLRAISHDLRTPLTSILGASSAILEQKDMDREMLEGFAGDIQDNAQWLTRMVENILTITRISRDTMKVQKNQEAAEEVVAESVAIVRKRFPDWQIHVRTPEELLLVPMDATLISQVLINLIENAVKNSSSGSLILVSLRKQEGFARFDVSDNGNGIPDEVMENLFDVHSTGHGSLIDSVRGLGIGLSICQAIIRAHDGIIEGCNRPEGGAKFSFLLPLETVSS